MEMSCAPNTVNDDCRQEQQAVHRSSCNVLIIYTTVATEARACQDVSRGACLTASVNEDGRCCQYLNMTPSRPAGEKAVAYYYFIRVLSCTATTTMNSESQIVLQGGTYMEGHQCLFARDKPDVSIS